MAATTNWSQDFLWGGYPQIQKSAQFDFNKNGKIENSEKLDSDGNGKRTDKEYWDFIQNNRPYIEKEIEGLALPDNGLFPSIINKIFMLESEVVSFPDTQKGYNILLDILTEAKKKD